MRDGLQALKRERIVAEAVRLFYERGYTGTTLDDIAAALGVTKPFIYTYFASKADLLSAVCLPTIEMSLAAVANAAAAEGTHTERLRRAIEDVTSVVLRRQAEIAIFFREEKQIAPDMLNRINALRERFDRVLAGLLGDGVSAGEFAVADADLASLALGGMISWSYTWHRPHGRLSADALAARMADLALGMVRARETASVSEA